MNDHGDLPIEDFTHILLKSVIYIRWTLVGMFILQVTDYIMRYL